MATTLAQILPEAAARHAARTALVVGDTRLTFDELRILADCYAIGVNDIVGVDVDP